MQRILATTGVALLLTGLFLAVGAAQKPAPPAKPNPALVEARQRLLKGNLDEARAAYDKLAKVEATRAPATIGLARVLIAEGRIGEAEAFLQAAVKTAPTDPMLLGALAEVQYAQGNWDDAEKTAAAALAKNPDQLQAKWTLAQIHSDRGKTDEADKLTRAIVRYYTARSNADNDIVDPDELLVVAEAGAENARRNNLAKQFSFILNEVLADALKAEPAFWPAEVLAGTMLLEKYNRPSAIEAFAKALTINPKCTEALVGKGLAALTRFDMKDVDAFAEQALTINPKCLGALHLKAVIDLTAGDWTAAEGKLEGARKLNPRSAVTLGRLAAVYQLQRKTPAFDAIVKEAEGYDTKPAQFYTELAQTLEERKRFLPAEAYYKKAAALRPNNATARNALGMLQLRLGNEAEGRVILNDAIKVDPFNVRTANTLKVLKHLDSYTTLETAHYILKYDREKDRILADWLAEYLEEMHAELKAEFAYEPPTKTLVELFSNHDMFSGRTIGLPDLHTIGACTGRVLVMASPRAKGVNKPFHWGRVIRHELTHIFNLAQTDFTCPHWFTEGLAVGNERMARPPSWTLVLRDRFEADTLFNLDTVLFGFVRPKSGDEWALAYCQSKLYIEYLVKTHGQGSIAKLLNAYRDGQETAEAIRTACGVDKATFEKGYRAYVAEVVKPFKRTDKAEKPMKPMTFDELEKANRDDPGDADIAAQLAEALVRRDSPKEAKKLIERILEADPTHPGATMVRARLLLRSGENEAAKATLEKLRKAKPNDARLLMMLARVHLESKEYDDAADVLEQGRKVAPIDGDWLEQLARLYRATENNEKLTGVLTELTSLDPDELLGRIELAKVHAVAKNHPRAEYYAREALFIDVLNDEARELLLAALKAQGKDAEAAKIVKRYAVD